MRHNYIYLLLLLISAVVFAVFICPVLQMHDMGWLCYLFYAIVILTFLYGRVAGVRSGPRAGPRS